MCFGPAAALRAGSQGCCGVCMGLWGRGGLAGGRWRQPHCWQAGLLSDLRPHCPHSNRQVLSYVEKGRKEGATLGCGGRRVGEVRRPSAVSWHSLQTHATTWPARWPVFAWHPCHTA